MMRKWLLPVATGLVLAGCGTTTIARYPAAPDAPRRVPQKLVVVIDGTSNDARDRTNASRIHELISNQDRSNLSVFYTEGVGSDGRIGGMATGWGMAKDVRDAYRFLAETWDPGDRDRDPGDIYLFGFSRGAFAGRILTGMIYAAGIIDLRPSASAKDKLALKDRQILVDRIYDAIRRRAISRPGERSGSPRPGSAGKP